MAVSDVIPIKGASPGGEGFQSITREYVEQLCGTCQRFLRWEREHMLQIEPSPQEREEHRQTLKWLMRAVRLAHSLAADPDFPEPSARELLEAVIWQLEQSWKGIYEPMPEAEAAGLLAEVFPDEPRT